MLKGMFDKVKVCDVCSSIYFSPDTVMSHFWVLKSNLRTYVAPEKVFHCELSVFSAGATAVKVPCGTTVRVMVCSVIPRSSSSRLLHEMNVPATATVHAMAANFLNVIINRVYIY